MYIQTVTFKQKNLNLENSKIEISELLNDVTSMNDFELKYRFTEEEYKKLITNQIREFG